MSDPDLSSEKFETENSEAENRDSGQEKVKKKVPSRARIIRRRILFSLLGLMLLAIVYDYYVARPGVERAYDTINQLNLDHNSSQKRPMTATEVQAALKRKPSRVFVEGPYQVEVYGWTAGLPYRSHDYYVVYTGEDYLAGIMGWTWSGKLAFLTHYKFAIPEGELTRTP